MIRTRVLAVLAVGALVVAGCSGSDSGAGSGGAADSGAPSVTSPVSPSPDSPATSDEGASTEGGHSPGGSTLTSEQICERLNQQLVANDLGLVIEESTAETYATPQCSYRYASASGGASNITVAAMRPEDVDGAVGSEAFDAVVELNRSVGDDETVEQRVDAGDAAVRLSGPALHLGVLQLGDHVFTLIVPAGDAQPDSVDRLIATMATVFA